MRGMSMNSYTCQNICVDPFAINLVPLDRRGSRRHFKPLLIEIQLRSSKISSSAPKSRTFFDQHIFEKFYYDKINEKWKCWFSDFFRQHFRKINIFIFHWFFHSKNFRKFVGRKKVRLFGADEDIFELRNWISMRRGLKWWREPLLSNGTKFITNGSTQIFWHAKESNNPPL